MPNGICTYQYKCLDCGVVIEEQHRFTHHPSKTTCPKCEGKAVRYFGTVPPIHFIGHGWSIKNLVDPMDTTNPRNDPLFFDDLIEREEDLAPTKHYT